MQFIKTKNNYLHFAHFTTLHSLDGCLSFCNNSIDLYCVYVCVFSEGFEKPLQASPRPGQLQLVSKFGTGI